MRKVGVMWLGKGDQKKVMGRRGGVVGMGCHRVVKSKYCMEGLRWPEIHGREE